MRTFIAILALCLSSVAVSNAAPRNQAESAHAKRITVWKTIELGTYRSDDALLAAIRKNGMEGWAPEFKVAKSKTTIALARVSGKQLGLNPDDSYTWDEILEKGKLLGLVPCPAEAGPQLRLQYPNQPEGEILAIMMEPVFYREKKPYKGWYDYSFVVMRNKNVSAKPIVTEEIRACGDCDNPYYGGEPTAFIFAIAK